MNEQLQSRPLIEAKGLSRIFGSPENQTVALQNVNLTIPTGSFTSIMGASCSGKSTLLHLLGLLDYPTSGTYTLDGIDTGQLDEAARAHLRNQKIGFVFQSFHLLARTTVLENVMLPLAYSKVPARQHRERAEHALTQVQLSHRLDHTQGQLSGGEKQRVAMARALVNNPDIIFAD